MKHVTRGLAAFLLTATLATAPAWADSTGVTADTITLGSWSALTGPFAVYGVPGVAGQTAFYGKLNAEGGINGRKIRVITEDHAYNPQQAVAAARKLVNRDKVLAIQGAYGTGPSAAAFPYLQQESAPFVMPYAGALDWYEPPRPLLVGAQTLLDYQARAVGRWAGKDGHKNVAVVHAAVAAYEKVASNVGPGVKSASPDATVTMVPVKLGTTDYAPIALELAGKAPDAVVFIGTMQELAALAKELRQQKVKTSLYTYGGNVANDLITLGGEAVEGLRSVSLTLPVTSDAPAVAAYREALAKFAPNEKPDYGSLLTYALAMVTAEAIRNAGEPLTRESLMTGFNKLRDFDTGIIGKVTITPERRLGTTEVIPVEIKGGQWVTAGTFVDALSNW
ncbi:MULTISPECIES: ABC transporter substrate-binding protein [unclassified Chelatococcus]|uniref:ABC transporter substrate-binding protein n=1 Tax=unclassified Chelatococcus TaxID=2638111 RepID=UPI001BCBFC45|nr:MULTISPECIES: ABC transporter substrate-binding protein [unclassified Chelatococcus]MBS7742682.1 ABC transporter substrate-binding protein [Chelatococcus sp. HY11]MBX3542200.1 ABC transporter substrate-binding protein [Chelatococcus sp.]MCO5075583.1 ABC transporter substrate-binding protein [Chelatococcus sp.]